MTYKQVTILTILILLNLIILTNFDIKIGNSSQQITVPTQCPTITKAIEEANPGDTIHVKPGVYYENLQINKPLTLQGEDKRNTIIIGKGNQSRGQETVITITTNQVEILGFTIKSQNYTTPSLHASGISLEADDILITDNLITNNFYGIFCSIQSNITIIKNQITQNLKDGIRICGGSMINISENNITHNTKGAITIKG